MLFDGSGMLLIDTKWPGRREPGLSHLPSLCRQGCYQLRRAELVMSARFFHQTVYKEDSTLMRANSRTYSLEVP